MEHKIDSKYMLLKFDQVNKLTNSKSFKAKSFFFKLKAVKTNVYQAVNSPSLRCNSASPSSSSGGGGE